MKNFTDNICILGLLGFKLRKLYSACLEDNSM